MNDCIIGIGSNIGAAYHIAEMLKLLEPDVRIVQVSQMIQTTPIGTIAQPEYTNGAVRIHTEMDQNELTSYLKSLEDRMGRDRTQDKFGPRIIDLDIMIWNGQIVDPDYHSRDFMRKSAAELGFEDQKQ